MSQSIENPGLHVAYMEEDTEVTCTGTVLPGSMSRKYVPNHYTKLSRTLHNVSIHVLNPA